MQLAIHRLLRVFAPVDAALRKLPRVGAYPLTPKHLVSLVEQDDADIGAKAVPVKHNQLQIFKLKPLCTASLAMQALAKQMFHFVCHFSLKISLR
jgi:hypothetical protein